MSARLWEGHGQLRAQLWFMLLAVAFSLHGTAPCLACFELGGGKGKAERPVQASPPLQPAGPLALALGCPGAVNPAGQGEPGLRPWRVKEVAQNEEAQGAGWLRRHWRSKSKEELAAGAASQLSPRTRPLQLAPPTRSRPPRPPHLAQVGVAALAPGPPPGALPRRWWLGG